MVKKRFAKGEKTKKNKSAKKSKNKNKQAAELGYVDDLWITSYYKSRTIFASFEKKFCSTKPPSKLALI